MLVTHFGKYASPSSGGMEMFLYTLCQGLTARGWRVRSLSARTMATERNFGNSA